MTDDKLRNISFRRLRAVFALRETTLVDTAKRVGCTPSHLRFVLIGARQPSSSLRSRLKRELREDEWSFARGETDVLRDHFSNAQRVATAARD